MIVSGNVFLTCLWAYVLRNELHLQGDPKSNDELKSEPKAPKLGETDTQMIEQLPQVETIGMIMFFHWIHLPSLHLIIERENTDYSCSSPRKLKYDTRHRNLMCSQIKH